MYGLIVLIVVSFFIPVSIPVSHRVISFLWAAFAIFMILKVFAVHSKLRWAKLSCALLMVGLVVFEREISHVPEPVARWVPLAFLGAIALVSIVEDPTAWWAGKFANRNSGHQGK
jgi:hypothetical protein